MKIKYILAGAIVAMLVVPGTASQLAVRSAISGASQALPAPTVTSAGAFDDPNAAPTFSIALPTKFSALDIGTHELQTFGG